MNVSAVEAVLLIVGLEVLNVQEEKQLACELRAVPCGFLTEIDHIVYTRKLVGNGYTLQMVVHADEVFVLDSLSSRVIVAAYADHHY